MRTHPYSKTLVFLSVFLTSWSITQAADFVVTKVKYTDTQAYFTLKSTVPAGDTAVVKLEYGSEIRQSLHTPISAEITLDNPTTPTEITVKVKASVATDVTVTYRRPVRETELQISYRLDRATKKLKGFAKIKDESGSESNWVKAAVAVKRATGSMTFTDVDLDSTKHSLFSSQEFDGYQLDVAEIGSYVRTGDADFGTDGTRAYKIISLINRPATPVSAPKGTLHVFDGHEFLYTRQIPEGLPAGKATESYGTELQKVTATPGASPEKFIEVETLIDGLLTTRKWKTQAVTVTNKTNRNVRVRLGGRSRTSLLAKPHPAPSLIGFVGEERTTETEELNLIDISSGFDNNLGALKVIQVVPRPLSALIKSVQNHYEAVAASKKEVATLSNAVTVAETVLKELDANPDVPPSVRTRFAAGVDRIRNRHSEAQKVEPEILARLVNDLFSSLTIDDALAAEGSPLIFATTLSSEASADLELELYAAARGPHAATATVDFKDTAFRYSVDEGTNWLAAHGANGTAVTIPSGKKSILVEIETVVDNMLEKDETLTLGVRRVIMDTVNDITDVGVGTIQNDD